MRDVSSGARKHNTLWEQGHLERNLHTRPSDCRRTLYPHKMAFMIYGREIQPPKIHTRRGPKNKQNKARAQGKQLEGTPEELQGSPKRLSLG